MYIAVIIITLVADNNGFREQKSLKCPGSHRKKEREEDELSQIEEQKMLKRMRKEKKERKKDEGPRAS